jgi:hypothetical protein
MARSRTWNAAIAATLLCFAPLVARADAASDARLAALEARIGQLESKLEASEKTIADQQELLKAQATPAVSASSDSKLDAWFDTVTIGGYTSASFIYNQNNPDNPIYAQSTNQFDLDHNTFKIDAAKLELGRAAAAPGEAGFQIDLVWGDNAGILGGSRFNTGGWASDNFSYLQEAYASYNWNDVVFKFGKWETLLGYEVIDTVANKNVTQGLLFTYAIPLVHTGLLASGKMTESVGWAAAFANGWNNVTDTNDNKGVIGQLNYTGGPFFTALNVYYGSDGNTGFTGQTTESNNQDRATVVDWLAQFTVSDSLNFWLNVDYGTQEDVLFLAGPNTGETKNAQWIGGTLGMQYLFNEKTSLALRGEVLRDSKGYRMFVGNDTTAYSGTATLGYKLTDNLLTRLEVRYDSFDTDDSSDEVFPQGAFPGGSDDEVFGLLNVAYIFD